MTPDNFKGDPFASDDSDNFEGDPFASDDSDNFEGNPFATQPATSMADRFVAGLADPVIGAAQLAEQTGLPHVLRRTLGLDASTSMNDVVRERDDAYHAPEGIDWARMAGNIANPVSWANPGAGIGRAVLGGAAQAALAPVEASQDFWTAKGLQTGAGGLGGAVLSKAIAGLRPTAAAQGLMEQGIQPSVGQSLGGIANNIEQKMTSVPFVGDAITGARARAQKEFESAVLQRAVGMGAPKADRFGFVPNVTTRAPITVDSANEIARKQFDTVVPHLRAAPNWMSGIPSQIEIAAQNPELTEQTRRVFTGIMADVLPKGRIETLSGPELKKLDSQLGYLTRKYAAGDPAHKSLADSIRNVHDSFRTELNALLPKGMEDALTKANATWRNLVPINKAASARTDEAILPRALQKAVSRQRGLDSSRMPFDSLVDNAVQVLPSTVPDSGTTGRALLGGAGAIGSASLGLLPAYLGAGLTAYAGAARPVQRAIMGNSVVQKVLSPHDARMAALMAAALRGDR